MNRKIDFDIIYKKFYPKPPKVKILEPPKAEFKHGDAKGFRVTCPCNPHITKGVQFVYTVNDERMESRVNTQFCPACENLLGEFLAVGVVLNNGKIVPMSLCHVCGNVFIATPHMKDILDKVTGKKRIIIPGRG